MANKKEEETKKEIVDRKQAKEIVAQKIKVVTQREPKKSKNYRGEEKSGNKVLSSGECDSDSCASRTESFTEILSST